MSEIRSEKFYADEQARCEQWLLEKAELDASRQHYPALKDVPKD